MPPMKQLDLDAAGKLTAWQAAQQRAQHCEVFVRHQVLCTFRQGEKERAGGAVYLHARERDG
jgi:hypothetical protein